MNNDKRIMGFSMAVFTAYFPIPSLRQVLALLSLMLLALSATAQVKDNGLTVSIPNGYANIQVEDLHLQSTAGAMPWVRAWDGQEWKFNPHWESLSQSWKNLMGSQTADTTGGTLTSGISGGGSSSSGGAISSSSSSSSSEGCWVWVDEDWQPSVGTVLIGGLPEYGPMLSERTTPFNRVMGEGETDYPPPILVTVDYAALCMGVPAFNGNSTRDVEGLRRQNELYLGASGRYAFNNRATVEKRAVQMLPETEAATLSNQLASGNISLAPVTNPKGFHWMDRSGDWIDYNTQGQVVAYGDKNDNTVWLTRDTGGMVRGVVDAHGRVLLTLHYTGRLVTEVRDYPVAGNALDLPQRSVKYQYDGKNRLTQVTDVRGNVTRYDYNVSNRIIKITDPEGRVEQIDYSGDTVVKRTAPDGGVTDYAFDYDDANQQFASKLTEPETTAGRRVQDYTHNRSAKLVRQVINGVTWEEVRYDTGARMEIHTNARGFATRTTRNEFEQVVQIDQPDGTTIKRAYSALNLQMTEETDEVGVKTQYQYDAKGNLLKKTEAVSTPVERVTEYQVNSLGQTVKLTRKGRTEANGTVTPDAVWQIEFDGQGQIKKSTDPEGNASVFTFDRAGNMASYTDPLSHTSRFEVDATGNLIKLTDALGRVHSYAYDKVGNLTTFTDARGKQTKAAYDAMNRPTQTTNPVGGIAKSQYNGQGQLMAITDEDGRIRNFDFDNFLRLTRQSDALGNKTDYSYYLSDGTAAGALGTLSGPVETKFPTFTRQDRYDSLERPTLSTLIVPNRVGSDTQTSNVTYDVQGRIKSETDANGKTRAYTFDALGQRIESTDSLGNKTKAAYDAHGNLIQLTDALGHSYGFAYDHNNRIAKETLPLGQATTYQYDAAGNLVERIDPDKHKLAYRYDAANRLIEVKHYQFDASLARTTTLTWDDADNLIAWTDTDPTRNQTSSVSASFDAANRKTGETVTYPDGYTLSYAYDYSLAGKKTRLTWPDGTPIDYTYSDHGELASVTIPGEGSISVNQFKWTAPEKTTLPGGSTQNKTFDGLLKLDGYKAKTPDQQTLLDMSHQYGKVQELKVRSRTDTLGGSSNTLDYSYTYDAETRLTQTATGPGDGIISETEDFTLDAVGNRIAHSRTTGAWTYDANNRLNQRGTSVNVTFYQYDDAGNLTQQSEPGKTTRYTYDTQNRLIEVRDDSDNLIARYGYDPLDRRIWKEQYRDQYGNALVQAKRTYYVYADEGLLAESIQGITLNADGTVTAATTPKITAQYGPTPDAEFTTGILFVKTQNSNGQDTVAYYHHDHLQTPIQATDKQGNLVWSATYEPFGKATITTPAATVDNPKITSNLRLPGQYFDDETGLQYNFKRYYDPSSARYITQDPVGLEYGLNSYVYANHNPLYLIDPFGLFGIRDALGFVPVVGSGLDAYDAFKCGNIGRGLLNLGLAVTDLVGLGAIVKGLTVGTMKYSARKQVREVFRNSTNWPQMRTKLQNAEIIPRNTKSIPRGDWLTTDHIFYKQRSNAPHNILNNPANLQTEVPQSLNSRFEFMGPLDRALYLPSWMKLGAASVVSYSSGLFVGSGCSCN